MATPLPMRGLWLQDRVLTFRDQLPRPVPGPGEALVRVRLAGVCGTDLELRRGYYPYCGIPGHEFVGEVVGGDATALLGRRVVGEINRPCGHCETCRAGRPSHCDHRAVLGLRGGQGAFAEYLCLPEGQLHPVPGDLPDQLAVFAEPLAAALQIQTQLQVRPTDRVLVVGAGRLGQLIAQTLALTGCGLAAVARHPRQRQLLAERGIALLEEDGVPARHFDVVVEASGAPAGFALARRAVRPRGTLVLKSTYRGEPAVDLSALVVDEITLVGSRCGSLAAALRLLERRAVCPEGLIEASYPLELGLEAFERAAQPGVLKVLLQP
ncbi:MDR/zinc-dependent alcohol dehydrogenase-like family protein [Candidatus Methylocalor cossyra]|uniref:Threonine dehydrogenase and related Zn-dependent dehydrogenases n=1 Tax=Candidatus Methylocalor cossyra TaxID=3108543 RepID=A0ABM9NG15_9GAMM